MNEISLSLLFIDSSKLLRKSLIYVPVFSSHNYDDDGKMECEGKNGGAAVNCNSFLQEEERE
jgi:hypothetical protein